MERRRIILISTVVVCHLVFFFFDFNKKKSSPLPKKSIVVHTYAPPPPKKNQKSTTISGVKPKSNTTPAPANKAPSKSLSPSSAIAHNKKEVLKELKEALSKIEKNLPSQTLLSVPEKIQNLQIDFEESEEESDYFILLAHSLKEGLELPEYGEVKLELTVNKNGKVIKLRVLHAQSEKNQKYLEYRLREIILPSFTKELKNQQEHTFTLTFCNET